MTGDDIGVAFALGLLVLTMATAIYVVWQERRR